MKLPLRTALCALAGTLLIAAHASASMATYGFYKLTNNNAEDISSQLSITLWDSAGANTAFGTSLAASEVLFTVQNNVGTASNIAEVYFDDGLLGPSVVINSLGGYTAFTGGGATPGNLPAGNTATPAFVATQEFSADVDPGNPSKGVNASNDILGIVLGLGGFADFDAVTAAVASGDLRFGLHVRSIGVAGGSDSYVNTVPVPAAAWLFGSALIGLAGLGRKRH
jgi:hypothetical protein